MSSFILSIFTVFYFERVDLESSVPGKLWRWYVSRFFCYTRTFLVFIFKGLLSSCLLSCFASGGRSHSDAQDHRDGFLFVHLQAVMLDSVLS